MIEENEHRDNDFKDNPPDHEIIRPPQSNKDLSLTGDITLGGATN